VRGSLSSAAGDLPWRRIPASHDEQIAQLEQSSAQPIALIAGELRQRCRQHRELIRLELQQYLARGIPSGREERGRWKTERRRKTREDGRAGLFDAARLELGDRAAGDADARCELGLREMQLRALLAYKPAKRRWV